MQRPLLCHPAGPLTTARQGKGGERGVTEQKLSKDFLLLFPGSPTPTPLHSAEGLLWPPHAS